MKLFRTLKQAVNDFVEVAQRMNSIQLNFVVYSQPPVLTEKFKEHNAKFSISSNTVALRSNMPNRIPLAMVCHTDDGVPLLIVNEKFMEMDVKFQEAILLHEFGHLVHEHKFNSSSYKTRDIIPEFEADEYAIAHGGNMIHVLKTYIDFDCHLLNKKELKLRLERALQLQC